MLTTGVELNHISFLVICLVVTGTYNMMKMVGLPTVTYWYDVKYL
jgi:hypothetical protein